jgi:spoIIIJ-associated protein
MTEDTLSKSEAGEVVANDDSLQPNVDQTTKSDESSELVTEGDTAADYLEGLLDIIDLDGDIDIDVENDRAAVAVVEVNSGELAQLVGEDGKVLDALQELTRLAVAREVGHRSRLMLDVAGFRAQRREELQRIAVSAVAEARAAQEPVRLDSMNAFERKVVHDAVAEAGLSSESEGSDPDRYVVISLA